jgi:hypothetical protein
MNDFQTINLKEFNQTEFQAIKELEIFVDLCKKAGVKAIKVIHGYGSHGRGGAISKSVFSFAKRMEKLKVIKFFILGYDWNLANEKALKIIYACKSSYGDEDLNRQNPGITILFL